jgi:hypothetical protein
VIVTRKDKVNLSQGLVLNTKMHVLREPSKQSCTWHKPLWYMPPCIGQIMDLMIYLSGLLRLSIQYRSTIVFRMLGQDLLLWN